MKIIVANTQEAWRPVFLDMLEQHGIEPLLMVNPGANEAPLLARLPGLIVINWYQIMRGDFSGRLHECACGPFDEHCQRVWNEDSPLLLDQYNRLDHSLDFILQDRKLHLFQQLTFWNSVLAKLRPDVVLFPFTPHVLMDNVILALAKARGIPVVQCCYALEPGKWVPCPSETWVVLHRRMKKLISLEEQAGLETLMEHLNEYHSALLTRMDKGQTAYEHASFANPEASRKTDTLGNWCRFWLAQSAPLMRGVIRSALDLFGRKGPSWCGQKEADRSYAASYTGPTAGFRFQWHNMNAKRKGRALKHEYDRQAARNAQFKPKPGIKYVFFALHYQPECTTNPLGGIFTDAYLAVNMLLHSLPDGWELLIKEHSAQFFTDYPEHTPYQGHIPRPDGYYELLSQSERAHLLPLHFPSPAVLEWCHAVATITGTVGVESLWQGKPALVFGDAFYNAIPGIFKIHTLEDCVHAMKTIDAGFLPSRQDMIRFLDELELHQCEIGMKIDFRDRSWTGAGDGFADALAGAMSDACGQPDRSVRLPELIAD